MNEKQNSMDDVNSETKVNTEPKKAAGARAVRPPKRSSLWKPITAVVALAAGAAALTQFVILPTVHNNDAQDKLNQAVKNSGPVVGINTKMVKFNGDKIKGTNVHQSALSTSTFATTPPAFLYTNGKQKFEGQARRIEMYVDFSSQPSRDVILLNASRLEAAVRSGNAVLSIHPVPTKNRLNIYSSEALAESFAQGGKNSWAMLLNLLKNSAAMTSEKTPNKLIATTANVAKESGVSGVDAASIKNGSFASWIISGSKDVRLLQGYYPPMIYVNGIRVDSKNENLNDSSVFNREVLGEG